MLYQSYKPYPFITILHPPSFSCGSNQCLIVSRVKSTGLIFFSRSTFWRAIKVVLRKWKFICLTQTMTTNDNCSLSLGGVIVNIGLNNMLLQGAIKTKIFKIFWIVKLCSKSVGLWLLFELFLAEEKTIFKFTICQLGQ